MNKWIFSHGCHKGTSMSRDTGQPQQFNTKKEALEFYIKQRRFYHSIGYQIWFAKLTSPDGKTETLEQNPYF